MDQNGFIVMPVCVRRKPKKTKTIPPVTMKVFCGDFLFVAFMNKEQRD